MAQAGQDIPHEFPPPKPLVISSINTIPLVRQESFLRQKYETEGLSIRQIAALTFSARATVATQLKAFKMPIRSCAQQLKFNKGQLAYGERQAKSGVIEHKGQGDVIGLMVRLRAKDYSYWKIAEELTYRGIPTKNRKEAWSAATVMKICKRAAKHNQRFLGHLSVDLVPAVIP